MAGSSDEATDRNPESVARKHEDALRELLKMPIIFEKRSKEHRHWWERFLFRCCELFHHSKSGRGRLSPRSEAAFLAYRSWARYQLERGPHSSLDITPAQRRSVWRSYLDLASQTLRDDLRYSPDGQQSEDLSRQEKRRLQVKELRRIESTYESILFNEVSFPDANTINFEVDQWTNQVVANWRILLGPEWNDEDLGEGGKQSNGRRVLEVAIPCLLIFCG